MRNIVTYMAEEQRTFAESPFNPVDSLVFATLAYFNYEVAPGVDLASPDGVLLHDVVMLSDWEALTAHSWMEDAKDTEAFLHVLSASRRMRDVRASFYANERSEIVEKQFSAVTLTFPAADGEVAYLAYRGTDGSFAGWKEDFNLCFKEVIPSQCTAAAYLSGVASALACPLIVGGHSKGGNLAVYSAAKSSGEIQERIVAVHNNDGPGFAWDISETPGHKRIASRIHTILPQTSVVGMLMEHEKRYQVVHSTYDGLYQHDGFSWQVLGTQFVHLDDFSREGKLVDETLSSWADSLNTQQREALADALYSVFTASGAKTLSELTEEKLKSAAAMLKTYKNLDRETRRMVTEAFMLFFKLGTKNFVLDTQEEGSREIENIRKKISEQYQKLVERKK